MVAQRSSNPTFSNAVYQRYAGQGGVTAPPMTVEGTVNKTLILLLLAVISASVTWSQIFQGNLDLALTLGGVGILGGFIVSLVTIFKPTSSPYTAPIYAVLEGLGLGAISAIFNHRYPGIAIQAVGLTFGTLFTMLLAYRSGFIKVTDKVRAGIVSATGGVCLFMLAAMVMNLFGASGPASLLWSSAHNPISIVICLVILGVAAMNLLLDFDLIERAVAGRMPVFMEWYCGFGVMVTLVWLYIRFLRLLSQLSGRR